MMPVKASYNPSGFGKRIDPFNGQWAMHDGIDFIADYGSPIVAAAGGVMIFSGFHPQYGYMVDIDHGNDLVTRYAHAPSSWCAKAISCSADARSPKSAPPAARPGRTCISRCASGARRKTGQVPRHQSGRRSEVRAGFSSKIGGFPSRQP